MAAKKQRRGGKGRGRERYVPRDNAVCITIHSQNGAPVSNEVLDQAASAVTQIALDNDLLINVAST